VGIFQSFSFMNFHKLLCRKYFTEDDKWELKRLGILA